MLKIFVPYRSTDQSERAEQLKVFIPHMEAVLKPHVEKFRIFVVEQSDDGRKFNRGALLNAGVRLADVKMDDTLCFHDVDLLPMEDVAPVYGTSISRPLHIGRAWKRYDTDTYLGGVLMMTAMDFAIVNGFPNDFWGWGGEDDELRDRLMHRNIRVDRLQSGTIVDQEKRSLEEKMSYLRENKGFKCMDKWETRAAHQENRKQNVIVGLRELECSVATVVEKTDKTTMFTVVLS